MKVWVKNNTVLLEISVSWRERQRGHRPVRSTPFDYWLRDNNVHYSLVKGVLEVLDLSDPLPETFFCYTATLKGLGSTRLTTTAESIP